MSHGLEVIIFIVLQNAGLKIEIISHRRLDIETTQHPQLNCIDKTIIRTKNKLPNLHTIQSHQQLPYNIITRTLQHILALIRKTSDPKQKVPNCPRVPSLIY